MTQLATFNTRRTCRSLLLAAAACVVLLFSLPSVARAHAVLEHTVPPTSGTTATEPASVTLTFDEHVTLRAGAVKVFAPDGSEVQAGAATVSGVNVVQPLKTTTSQGEFSVLWRVTSADGHEVGDVFTFNVGSGAKTGVSSIADKLQAQRKHALRTFAILRGLQLFALLLAAGGGLFATFIAPTWRPRLLPTFLLLTIILRLASFFSDNAVASGSSYWSALKASAFSTEAQTRYGRAMLIGAALAIIALPIALLLQQRHKRLSTLERGAYALVFAALAASAGIVGHATVDSLPAIRISVNMVHIIAASIWFGGLIQLRLLTRDASANVDSIERFSKIAFACVGALVLTGIYATVREMNTLSALIDSHYGRILLGKLVLFAATMPLAALNKYITVPAIKRRPLNTSRLLTPYVYREAFLVAAIVALTSWLSYSTPPHG